ncbi:MAG: quinol:cytochrome C oxidoreductase [Fibrobacteria bacterium]|nr:quinol:cytochrome C oxidoreductase [Fibrobacteria bacterium]
MEQTKFSAGKGKAIFLIVTALGAAASAVALMMDARQFAFSYLTAFCFFLSISLGGLAFVLLQHLTRAGWSVVVRRIAENITANLMWMGVLIIPLLAVGIHTLFHWSHAEAVAHDPIMQAKASYFNLIFFISRTVVFFAIWAILAWWLLKKSVVQDTSGDKAITLSLQKWSTLGIILYAASETFFSFDWIMSLNPHWFSTIFGVYYFSCSAVAIYSMIIMVAYLLQKKGYVKDAITVEHYHDLGKLLFGFNAFWAYIAYCQFLLIWYGNLGEETPFFHLRAEGSWKTLSVAMIFIHFVIPFFYFISRIVKRNLLALFVVAVWLFFANYLDIYWLIMPNINTKGMHITLGDVGSFLFIGGLFFYFLLKRMEKSSLIPQKDPRLPESLKFTNA